MSKLQTGAFGIEARNFDAQCTNVQDHYWKPKNAAEEEVCNLTFMLRNVTPFDLRNSKWLLEVFRLKNNAQTTLDSFAGKVSDRERADFNSNYDTMKFSSGAIGEADKRFNIFVVPSLPDSRLFNALGAAGAELWATLGLELRDATISASNRDGAPAVDLEVVAKGLDVGVAGYGWRVSGPVCIRFIAKSEDQRTKEEEKDNALAAAKRKDKNPDQQDIEEVLSQPEAAPAPSSGTAAQAPQEAAGADSGSTAVAAEGDAAPAEPTRLRDVDKAQLRQLLKIVGLRVSVGNKAYTVEEGNLLTTASRKDQVYDLNWLIEHEGYKPFKLRAPEGAKLPAWAASFAY